MGVVYTVQGAAFAPGGLKTIIGFSAAVSRPLKIRRLWISSLDTAGATICEVVIQRFTAAGTSTAVTPNPLNGNSAAAAFAAGQNHTVEPTLPPTILRRDEWNIQVPYELVLGAGEEFMVKGIAANGICVTIATTAPGTTIIVGGEVEED